MPEYNPKFQGLSKEGVALYLDVSAKLLGVTLEDDMNDEQVVTDGTDSIFSERTVAALENAGIDPHDQLHALQGHNVVEQAPVGPAPVDYNPDKIVYKTTYDLPDAGLVGNNVVRMDDYQQDKDDLPPTDTEDILANKPQQYPT